MSLIKKQTLFEPFQYKGYFWPPGRDADKCPGILIYKETEITLELFGGFHHRSMKDMCNQRQMPQEPIIVGILEGKKECTLFKNMLTNTNYQSVFGGVVSSQWSSEIALIGKSFVKPTDIFFTSVEVSFTYLEAWITKSPFQPVQPNNEVRPLSAGGTTFEFPERFDIHIPSLDATIRSQHAAITTGGMYNFHHIEHRASIIVTPESKQTYDWFFNVVMALQNLFVLLVGRRVYLRFFNAKGNEIPSPSGRNDKEEIDIVLRSEWLPSEEFLAHGRILFPYPTIQQRWPEILTIWFDKNVALKSVFNLFFSTYYKDDAYLEHNFLTLVQAVETYSRLTTSSKYVSDEVYKVLDATLVAAIPNDVLRDLRENLRRRIEHGNEYSLRMRMKNLLQSLEPETLKLFCPNISNFKNKMVDTRNYHTHYVQALEDNSIGGTDLYYANMRLQVFMIILLAKEIGMSETEIRSALTENSHWGAYIQQYLSKDF